MNSNWIIKNSPYEMLDVAFKNLFPGVEYKATFEPEIKDEEDVLGLTLFGDNGEIAIIIRSDLTINDSIEIFAHELAHAGVGAEAEQDHPTEKGGEG